MDHFYFVRHGETVWNVENKICGATDIALTAKGHEQAIETGKKILEEGKGIGMDIVKVDMFLNHRIDTKLLFAMGEAWAEEFRGEEPTLDEPYTAATELLAPFPYGWELYTAWLFAQIDLNNAELTKYNQSMTLFASAWRQLADRANRLHPALGRGGWRL